MDQRSEAFGKPGNAPRWTSSNKDGVGTAYSGSSRVWYTLHRGHLTELYYPTLDTPQVRDVRLLVTDGETFLHDEGDNDACSIERMCPSLGYRVRREDPAHRYVLEKTVIADPHLPCVLQHIRVKGKSKVISRLKVYVVCAPHLGMAGARNNAHMFQSAGRQILVAEAGKRWMAMAPSCEFSRTSVGYAGVSDGATDLSDGFTMKWNFSDAVGGNVVLTGEILAEENPEFTLAISFGETRHSAITSLFQSLATPFEEKLGRFVSQWERAVTSRRSLEHCASDKGNLYRASFSLLLAHEDKTYAGAQIASLTIPWGEDRGDEDGGGGYHLVWTRDLVQSATALLAAGQTETPRRTLIYLAVAQLHDGGFPQNFWVDGNEFRDGTQLDEVAFPVMLARRLHIEGQCGGFDPTSMVQKATRFLILRGPITEQERWEETGGYSPSTLASVMTACVCAASFATEAGDNPGAAFLTDYADWIHSHIYDWTVTNAGTLVEGVSRHFVRLNPAKPMFPVAAGSADRADLEISSQPPDRPTTYPAREIVDAGFLEFVRHGILQPDDPIVIDSLRVVDRFLKIPTPHGAAWRRYNHDGYGQRDDGKPYNKYGTGRAWPLLAGERGHYELIAGGDPAPSVSAMEKFGAGPGLLPEQIWDVADLPAAEMRCGYASGSARPLLWAHSEYIKLLRSIDDGKPYDRFDEVASRYAKGLKHVPPEFWTFHHPTPVVEAGRTLRLCADEPFRLHFSADEWKTVAEIDSTVAYEIQFVDLAIKAGQRDPIRFTMFWSKAGRWEGRDFEVKIA